MPNLLLIINPKSGKNKPSGFFESVRRSLDYSGWKVTVKYTEHRDHATELAQSCDGFERVVCIGGDGTLNEVINGLMTLDKRPQLGYVPAGSTNDFAMGIGLPKSTSRSSRLAGSYNVSPIDVGAFTDDSGKTRYFSYVASFGMFTKVSYSTNQNIKNIFGHMAYIFEGVKTVADLNNYKPFKMRIQTENSTIEQEYIFGAVTNSTSLGGLVKLDKNNVHVNDGVFEMLLIRKPKNLIDLSDTVGQLLNHKYRADRIIFSHTDHVVMSTEEPLDWTLDGEYAGKLSHAEIRVLPGALDFVRREEVRGHAILNKKTP